MTKPWGRLRDKAKRAIVVEARRIDAEAGRDAALAYLDGHDMGGYSGNGYRSAHRILDYETFRYIDCIPKGLPLWREQRDLEDAALARRKQARQFKSQLLERSGGKCEWCKRPISGSAATVDHIDPEGGNERENLAILCRSCNSRKSAGGLDRLTAIDAANERAAANALPFDCDCHHYGCEPDCSGCQMCGHDSETMPSQINCANDDNGYGISDCVTPSVCWEAHICQVLVKHLRGRSTG